MTAKTSEQRLFLFGGALVLVAVVLLSFPRFFFEPLTLLYRITDQALLILGFLGSVLRNKSLRVVGWIGIGLLFLYVVFGSLPSVDHPVFDSIGGRRRPEIWIWRPVVALVFYIAIVVCFKKLAPKPQSR